MPDSNKATKDANFLQVVTGSMTVTAQHIINVIETGPCGCAMGQEWREKAIAEIKRLSDIEKRAYEMLPPDDAPIVYRNSTREIVEYIAYGEK